MGLIVQPPAISIIVMKHDGLYELGLSRRLLWVIICVLSLRDVVAMPATFSPRIEIMQRGSKRKDTAAPCLSKPFDGAWIPEWQPLAGQPLLKGPCLLQDRLTVYHENKFHFTVDDKEPSDDGEVTFTFYGINATFARMKHSQASAPCKGALLFQDVPVVIAQRDAVNVYHVLNVQLVPIFTALREFGLDGAKFQIIFLNHWGNVADDSDVGKKWLGFFERMSGGVPPITPETLPATFCATTAIVGPTPHGPGLHMSNTDKYDYVSEHYRSKETMKHYVSWILQGFGLVQGDGYADPPKLLILERGPEDRRQMHGVEHIEKVANDRGWIVQKLLPSVTSIEDQLKAVLSANLLITVHGAAFALAAFLPRKAVAIELMPYGFVPGDDFYAGYANWLDMAGVTHIVWHEQGVDSHVHQENDGAKDIIRCGKQADLFLGYLDVVHICDAAHRVYITPLRQRPAGEVLYLNRPAVQHC